MIIIERDLNDSVQRHDHTQFFRELHMKEAILMIHSGTSLPVTTIRNKLKYPLDGIWCSLGLIVLRGECSKFEDGIPSDHRFLLVEC